LDGVGSVIGEMRITGYQMSELGNRAGINDELGNILLGGLRGGDLTIRVCECLNGSIIQIERR
jgi:hypothetical protein